MRFSEDTFQGTGNNNQPYTVNGPWQTHTKRMLRHKALIQCSRIAFGFVGIYDEDEAQRIIEGQAVLVNGDTCTTEPSAMAKSYLPKLVNRAQKDGSWQAALDYSAQMFSGFDAVFMAAELKKAKATAEVLLPNKSGAATATPGNAMPQSHDAANPVNNKRLSPLADAIR